MGVLRKAELPKWVTRINELVPNMTEAGLHGLLDHAVVLMPLGEMLARQQISRDELRTVVDRLIEQVRSKDTLRSVRKNVAIDNSRTGVFWEIVWEQILGRKIEVPPIPELKAKSRTAIEKYKFQLVYLPAISEMEYPEGFIKPRWGTDFQAEMDEHLPLTGRWMFVETIEQEQDSRVATDPLFRDHSDHIKRQYYSSESLNNEFIPGVARMFGLPKKAIRLPSVEELNLIGNVFRWLNKNGSMSLPELRQSPMRELCLNKCRGVYRLTLGGCGHYEGPEETVVEGGIARLGVIGYSIPSPEISFRLVIAL